MDPIAILQSRIEQLEAKLGLNPGVEQFEPQQQQQGDSATTNLLNASQAINHATAGHEKMHHVMNAASELNNYTDPNFVENMQQNQNHMQEVVAGEPVLQHHCQCMHHCKQVAPVLESEPIQQVPQMQPQVDSMSVAAHEIMQQSDQVAQGVQQLAESCGAAAAEASEKIAEVAQKVEAVEEKMFPRRRNGLD